MDKALSVAAVMCDPAARAALAWEHFRDGIEISWVYRTPDPMGPSAAFLRYAPGATVPRHAHDGFEHILVLEGSQTDDNGRHAAGALVVNPPGTDHAIVSEDGCLVLAIWQQPVRFLATGT